MEFKSHFDKIIHKLGNYESLTDQDIDYVIQLDTDKVKEVLTMSNKSLKALLLLNEFLIKEMD
jgi:hypothetical protein